MGINGVSMPVSSVRAVASQPILRASEQPVNENKNSELKEDQFQMSLQGSKTESEESNQKSEPDDASKKDASKKDASQNADSVQDETKPERSTTGDYSADELRMISELKARDHEVRAHEAAHQAAGGGHVGGASYSYQQGPDGRQYAIGGEVSVNMSTSGNSPEAIIAKMQQIRAAALAPADPSPQDLAVAAAAIAAAEQARQIIRTEDRTEQTEKSEKDKTEAKETDKNEKTDTGEEQLPLSELPKDEAIEIDLQKAHALAAYRAAQEQPYLSGLHLVG
jgi:SprA-related family